jgi:hypothetical protein
MVVAAYHGSLYLASLMKVVSLSVSKNALTAFKSLSERCEPPWLAFIDKGSM